MNPDTVVVLFVEGETEGEFYKALVQTLRDMNGRHLDCFIEYQVLKGVGNFNTKAERILKKDLMLNPKYRSCRFKILLCYDTDVFDRNENRVRINWNAVEKSIRALAVSDVFHVKASSTIEDWFLADAEGIKKFLGISKSSDISNYKGLKGLKNLFSRFGKSYSKGVRCDGLVSSLHMQHILSVYCKQIQQLCRILGLPCNHDGNCHRK